MALFSRLPFDKQKIEAAIGRLEAQTSAELRVYIERKKTSDISVLDRTLQIFYQFEMEKTQASNGVLIYIAFKDHQCAIIGDKGIDQYVEQDFWQIQCHQMTNEFRQQRYTEGVVLAIDTIAQKLVHHFPIQAEDQNELDNEVIINE